MKQMKQYTRRLWGGLSLLLGGLFVGLILPELLPAFVVALMPVGIALIVGGGALATSAERVQKEMDALPPGLSQRPPAPGRLVANTIDSSPVL